MKRPVGRTGGFTLIELLVVIAVIFILASMMIPLYMATLQKARQRRTMAEMSGLGKTIMSWVTDQASASAAGASVDLSDYPGPIAHDRLEKILVPTYTQELVTRDGWKHLLEIYLDESASGTHLAAIRSPGRDGVFSGDTYSSEPFRATDYDQDLVWADGFFVRWPD